MPVGRLPWSGYRRGGPAGGRSLRGVEHGGRPPALLAGHQRVVALDDRVDQVLELAGVGAQADRVRGVQRVERRLLGDELAQVPRVVGLLGAGRSQGQAIRRGDVRDGRAPAKPARSSPGRWTCSMVWRNTIASQAASNPSTSPPLKAQVRPAVAQPGVLVGLGIRVHPHDLAAASAPAPPTRSPRRMRGPPPVGPPRARRSTRTPPRGGGTSSSPRGHRATSAPRSAPTAGLPAAGSDCACDMAPQSR